MKHSTPSIVIIRKQEEEIVRGHQWVFNSSIIRKDANIQTGDIVEIFGNSGKSLGWGVFNQSSQIAVRFLSREKIQSIDELLLNRILAADRYRKTLFDRTAYRVVHGESDFLPGLIIDRYDDVIVVESLSAWIDQKLEVIVDILIGLFNPTCIIERSESIWRERETLDKRKRILYGEKSTTTIRIRESKYFIDAMESQKTGLFLDQIENHYALRKYSQGKNVLDCFCNAGGFALNAVAAGADSVIGIDSSERALAVANENAVNNDLNAKCSWMRGDVLEILPRFHVQSRFFDCVVLDPPAFVKNKSKLHSGLRGYVKLHRMGLEVLKSGGILVTCSCSHHVGEQLLVETLLEASQKANRTVRILETRGASPDHPVLPAMPETRYLSALFCRID